MNKARESGMNRIGPDARMKAVVADGEEKL